MTYMQKHERFQNVCQFLREDLQGFMSDKAIEDVIKYLFEKMFDD